MLYPDHGQMVDTGGLLSPPAPPTAHNLLSASHGDTAAGSPVQGDLIVGNVTPAWASLANVATGSALQSTGIGAALAWTATPTWSGRHAFTLGLDVLEQAVPASPTNDRIRIFAEDDNGFSFLCFVDSTGLQQRFMRDNLFRVRNTSGGNILKGEAVYVNGATGQVPNVSLAQANAEGTMAFGIAAENMANNAFGRVVVVGDISGLNTLAFAEGTVLYLSETTPGALTSTQPGHPNLSQSIGVVIRQHVNQGRIQVETLGVMGRAHGTIRNTFAIGDDVTVGAKLLQFKNGDTGTLSWNPTAARTLTLPDATGLIPYTAGFTTGRVLFGGTNSHEILDDALLFWDNTAKALGIGANPTSAMRLLVDKTTTSTAGTEFGIRSIFVSNPGAASSASLASISVAMNVSGSQNHSGILFGGSLNCNHNGTLGIITEMRGFNGAVNNTDTGTIVDAIGVRGSLSNTGLGRIGVGVALLAARPLNSGGGSFDEYYGLRIEVPTAAAANWAIHVQGGNVSFAAATRIGYDGASGATLPADYITRDATNQLTWFTNSLQALRLTSGQSVVFGQSGALATNATTGFPYMPSSAGTPTGAATAITGKIPFEYDTTNKAFYIRDGAATNPWRHHQGLGIVDLVDEAPVSLTVTDGNVFRLTATANRTINASGGGIAGQVITVMVQKTSGGNKTITFGTNFRPNGTLTASSNNLYVTATFASDGTDWLETARQTGGV